MVTVPTVKEPSVKLAPLRLPFQEKKELINKGGRTTAKIASAADKGGDILDAYLLKTQAEENERAAKNMDVDFSSQLRALLNGDGENPGLYDSKGETAVQGAVPLKESISRIRAQLSQNAPNKRVREAFGAAAGVREEKALGDIDRYVQGERISASNATSEARIKEAIDDAAASPFDPIILSRSLSLATSEVNDMALMQGWGPEVVASKLGEAQSAILSSAITSATQQNPTAAVALYERVKGSIDGSLHADIEKTLSDATLRQRAQAETDAIMSAALSTKEALDTARGIDDPDVRDEVVRRVKQRISEDKAVDAERAKAVEDEMYAGIWSGSSVDDMARDDPELYRQALKNNSLMVNLRNAEDALSNGDSYGRTTNPVAQTELELMAPADLANLNPLKYRHLLTKSDYGSLLDMVRGARASRDAASAKDPRDHELFSRAEAALKDFAPKWIEWGASGQSKENRKKQHRVHYEMTSWVQDQIEAGARPSIPDMHKKATELLSKVSGDTNWLLGLGGFKIIGAAAADLTSEQHKVAFVEPEEVPQHIMEGISARGLTLSEEQIGKIAYARIAGDKTLEAEALGLSQEEISAGQLRDVPPAWQQGFEELLEKRNVEPTEELVRALAFAQAMGDVAAQRNILRQAQRAGGN